MADDDVTANVEDAGGADKKASGGSPLLTLLVLLNTVMMGAVAWFQYQSHLAESTKPTLQDIVKAEMEKATEGSPDDSGEAREEDGALFPLETFTANLAQGDGPRRFVRLNAVLKFSKSSSEEEFKARKPQIRDAIIRTLNSKRPEELLKVEGKNYLKEEIKAAINAFMVDGHVIDVFYVGFQIN
ncbi:MAG: flagellar basal body-associated FliL family protein [Bacteriovoracaceae bacterium]|nr:flagellar basal body-associated FliL family protein [Bacteriovoracaceae bacterium]